MKESTRVVLALGLAIGGGIVIAALDSNAWLRAVDTLAPIGTLWVNAIRMTIIPLVASLLITGIASASDVRAIGRLGARTLIVFILLLVGAALVIMPLAPAVFGLLPADPAARPPLPAGAEEAARQLAGAESQTFSAWVASLIPANPIAAAAEGQMVSFILFVLFLALAIARSPDRSRLALTGFFQALGDAMLVLVRGVVLLAPIGVFCLVLPLAARSGASLAGAIGFYIVVYSLACILVTLLLYPVVALAARIPVRQFGRAALPAQLVAFSTSSSIASLPAQVEGAERVLGLSNRVTGFVLPVAVSMFKLAAPVSWTVGAMFVGWFYGIPLGVRELATIAFAAVFLAFAAPGVPRGAFILLTPLFVAIGLPPEGIGILIAIDVIPDVFSTVLNATGDLAAASLIAAGEKTPAG